MKITPGITNFNGGEISPLMAGRSDLKTYPNACRRIRNFIPTAQGPARRRPGTKFVAEVRNSAHQGWLLPFVFNSEQAYVVELAYGYMRFYVNHGQIAGPYEIASPYNTVNYTDANGLCAVRWAQSYDTMYLVCPLYWPQKLQRLTASTFSLTDAVPTDGPFNDIDPAQTISIYSSAATGATVTFTASANLFTADHVGRLIRLEQKNVDSILMWEPAKARVINDVRRSDGKNYHALNNATTGTVRPTHSYGAKYDGDAGVQWQFDDPGYGWGLITVYTSPTQVTVVPLSRFPDMTVGAGNPTTRWAFSPWSVAIGWPDNVAFYRERLVLSKNRTLWGSVVNDYLSHADMDAGVVSPDMAFTYTLAGDKADSIKWMAEVNQALLIGTGGDEHAVFEASNSDPFGPGNAVARRQSENGSKPIAPVIVGHGAVFVQKSGRSIRDMKSAESVTERWESIDLNVLAEHICKAGIVQIAYQHKPDSIIWACLTDGTLVGFTMDREQEVRGWHRHRIGGYDDAAGKTFAAVESIAVIPSPDQDRDELWMIVRREIGGVTKRYIEWMEYGHEKGDDPEDAFYLDSGLTLDNTVADTLTPGTGADVKGTENVLMTAGSAVFSLSPTDIGRFIHYRYSYLDANGETKYKTAVGEITGLDAGLAIAYCTILVPWPDLAVIPSGGWRMTVTTISGLTHLNGQTVDVLADGATQGQKVVSAGSITLDNPASKVHVGLPCPAVLSPMPIEMDPSGGPMHGKIKRSNRVAIKLDESAGVKYGRDETSQMDDLPLRGGGDLMDEPISLFTGDVEVAWPDGYERGASLTIKCDQPQPCTVVSISPRMGVQD